jgi:hypothetical protein
MSLSDLLTMGDKEYDPACGRLYEEPKIMRVLKNSLKRRLLQTFSPPTILK